MGPGGLKLSLDQLRYLPRGEELSCSTCSGTKGCWMFLEGGKKRSICATCVLYETEWGKAHAEGIESFVGQVEKVIGKPLERGSTGRLLLGESYRVVAALHTTEMMLSRLVGRVWDPSAIPPALKKE